MADGRIFCTPVSGNFLLIIDTSTNTFDATTITFADAAGDGWFGSALAPNGLIYSTPFLHDAVLVVDPATNAADDAAIPLPTTTTTTTTTSLKWSSALLTAGGKIVGVPYHADSVLLIDPETNTADTTTLPALSAGNHKFFGGVVAHSGVVYAVPHDSRHVLVIQPGC